MTKKYYLMHFRPFFSNQPQTQLIPYVTISLYTTTVPQGEALQVPQVCVSDGKAQNYLYLVIKI